MVPLLTIVAKSVPFTVAHAPRMPLVSVLVVVVMPLVVLGVPVVGGVKLTVLPVLRAMVPRFSKSGFNVALAVSVIAESPLLRARVSPLKV